MGPRYFTGLSGWASFTPWGEGLLCGKSGKWFALHLRTSCLGGSGQSQSITDYQGVCTKSRKPLLRNIAIVAQDTSTGRLDVSVCSLCLHVFSDLEWSIRASFNPFASNVTKHKKGDIKITATVGLVAVNRASGTLLSWRRFLGHSDRPQLFKRVRQDNDRINFLD